MKIVKAGKLPLPKVYRGECKNCWARIECSEHEVYRVYNQILAECPTEGCPCKINMIEGSWDDEWPD